MKNIGRGQLIKYLEYMLEAEITKKQIIGLEELKENDNYNYIDMYMTAHLVLGIFGITEFESVLENLKKCKRKAKQHFKNIFSEDKAEDFYNLACYFFMNGIFVDQDKQKFLIQYCKEHDFNYKELLNSHYYYLEVLENEPSKTFKETLSKLNQYYVEAIDYM